jgi:hypothetical protein
MEVEDIMLMGIQILGLLFGLFMLYFTFLHHKRNEIKQTEYIIWASLWFGVILITIFPFILEPFTRTLHLQRTMDLLILVGFVFVIGLMFNNYMSLRKTQKKVEEVVRKIAINKASKK